MHAEWKAKAAPVPQPEPVDKEPEQTPKPETKAVLQPAENKAARKPRAK